jgi:hypothetical protein
LRSSIVAAVVMATSVAAVVAPPGAGAVTEGHASGGQVCRFSFIHRVTRASGVTFAVQPVGNGLYGFHDTNTKKCQKQSADFYSCDGFSRVFK